ncbi:hypothetical protein BHM03_00046290 [Ensete ventricosum]|nr:hypothetical protein BHM03_00046290 [Ensete ventricosum]
MAFLADLANVTDDATTSMVAALQCYDATSRSGPRHRPRGMGIGRTPPRCHQSERPPGTGTLPDVMIYKEGGCQFGAVQAAVEAAPEHSAGRYVIYIKEGVYEEMVRVPFKKRNLVFIGDRMGKTINDGLPQQAIEEYKKSLRFEMGLVWIGRVSLEYGYQLALARLRARHPSLEIEANAFMLLPEDADMSMADEQPFDDSSPKAEE